MGGLIGLGNSMKTDALSGMRRLSELEQKREQTEEALDMQDKADRRNNQITGATMGAMAGASLGAKAGSVGGPYGMVIGAAVGFLAGSLF